MATRGATLKMVKEIHVAFDPFTGGKVVPVAREFVRRISSPKLLDSNPKFKLTTKVKCDGSNPFIEITYVDKEKQVLDIVDAKFNEIYANFIKSCAAKE